MTQDKGKMLSDIKQKSNEKFSFSAENLQIIQSILKKYPADRQESAVLPLLDLAQRQCEGWLPPPAIMTVASILNMPEIRVYEVASFYTMFHLKPVGKHHIQVCRTTPCWLRGSEQILATCKTHLGIQSNEVTSNGQFSLEEVECLGACINAPVVQINDTYYEDLTSDSMKEILQNLASGKRSSQNHTLNDEEVS